MGLCIVMPAYNEAACIQSVVERWLSLLQDWSKRENSTAAFLLVVNDGSKDATGSILDVLAKKHAQLRVVHQKNAGHGAAVLRGYQEALALGVDYIFQTDSDDQFKPEDFWQLWSVRKNSRFVTGYRKARSDAFHRLVITKIMLALNAVVFGEFLKDANIPYRLMETSLLRRLLQIFPNTVFAPNIFLTVLAKKVGCELYEFPIRHVERETGTVSIVRWKLLKSCFRCVRELVSFRLSLVTRRAELKSLGTRHA